MDQDLLGNMREQEDEVQKTCGQVTFYGVFWEEQAWGQKQKGSRGRWNPVMNKWCLIFEDDVLFCLSYTQVIWLPGVTFQENPL